MQTQSRAVKSANPAQRHQRPPSIPAVVQVRWREAEAQQALTELFPHLRQQAYNALRELFPTQSAQ